MLKRTLFFSTPYCLSLRNGQMIIHTREAPDQRKSIPIEDIGFVVLEDQQTSITLPLLNALSDNNVAVILCGENRMPNALLMNLDSNRTQGEHYRMQIAASEPLKKGLWKQIVETKIRNQAALLRKLGYDGDKLKPCYMNVKSADADNREGIAARIYWSELFGAEFYRSREGSPPNNLLNYGYTILRAAVARAIMGSGLFPAFGIFHRNRYNSFPLADDVMEPYRPYADELVYQLYRNGNTQLTKKVKGELLRLLFVDTRFDKVVRPLEVGLMFSASSLAKCFAGTQKRLHILYWSSRMSEVRLNAYRIMWLFVFFDLPTNTKTERRHAVQFRKALEKDGFTMMQYSVYVRHCASKENMQVHIKRVRRSMPPTGFTSILAVTDKQYGDILNFWGKSERAKPEIPQQLEFF